MYKNQTALQKYTPKRNQRHSKLHAMKIHRGTLAQHDFSPSLNTCLGVQFCNSPIKIRLKSRAEILITLVKNAKKNNILTGYTHHHYLNC